MSTDIEQRLFDKLESIQTDTATLLANRRTDREEIDRLRREVECLRSWRDQMVGRLTVVGALVSLVFGIVGSLVCSAWKHGG